MSNGYRVSEDTRARISTIYHSQQLVRGWSRSHAKATTERIVFVQVSAALVTVMQTRGVKRVKYISFGSAFNC